jgi:hypothetical protein
LAVAIVKSRGDGCDIERIAGDATPYPGGRIIRRQNAYSGRDLAKAISLDQPLVAFHPEHTGERARSGDFRHAESDAEPAEAIGDIVSNVGRTAGA